MSWKERLPPFSSLSIPDVIQYSHVIPFVLFLAYNTVLLIVSLFVWIEIGDFIIFGAILLTWLLTYGAVVFLKKWMTRRHEKNGADDLTQSKQRLLMGLTGGLVFGWIPRIYVCIDWYDSTLLFYFLLISLPAILLFWHTFVFESKKTCKVVYKKGEKLPWIIVLANIVALIAAIKFGITGWYVNEKYLWCHLGFAPICTICMMEIGQVWRGKIKMIGEVEHGKKFGIYEKPLIMESGQSTLLRAEENKGGPVLPPKEVIAKLSSELETQLSK